MLKAAIVILTEMDDSHADLGRVVNALQTAKEFKAQGDDVQIIFDGGGTVTAVQLADPNHRMHKQWQQLEDSVAGLCRYCARAFDAYERAEELGLTLLDEFQQHPSLRKRVAEGYQVLTF